MRASKENCRETRALVSNLYEVFRDVFEIGDDDVFLKTAKCPTQLVDSSTDVFEAEGDGEDPVCKGCRLKLSEHEPSITKRFDRVVAFLDAAERKLPSDAAFDRDKAGRKERDRKRRERQQANGSENL